MLPLPERVGRMAVSCFSFRERRNTVAVNVEGVVRNDGSKLTMDTLVDFLKNDVKIDVTDVTGVQLNDLMSPRTVLIKMKDEESAARLESLLEGGIEWTSCRRRRTGGWRCDSRTLVVKIMYVSFEVPLDVVKFELEKYSVVKEINWSCRKVGSLDVKDGVIMARIEFKEGVTELPCWVRREAGQDCPAEVWRLQHRGQQEAGCWRCGQLGHIGKYCRGGAAAAGRWEGQRRISSFAAAAARGGGDRWDGGGRWDRWGRWDR